MKRLLLVSSVILWGLGMGEAAASGEASLMAGRSFVGDFRLEDHTNFGGTLGAYSGPVGVEFGVDYLPVTDFAVGSAGFGASLWNLMGNVIVQIPIGPIVPFGTVGYGAVIADADTGPGNDDFLGTFGALNYGFGGKFFFSDPVGVRVDYRRFAVQTGDDEADLRIPLTDERIETDPDFDRLMFGVVFRW